MFDEDNNFVFVTQKIKALLSESTLYPLLPDVVDVKHHLSLSFHWLYADIALRWIRRFLFEFTRGLL